MKSVEQVIYTVVTRRLPLSKWASCPSLQCPSRGLYRYGIGTSIPPHPLCHVHGIWGRVPQARDTSQTPRSGQPWHPEVCLDLHSCARCQSGQETKKLGGGPSGGVLGGSAPGCVPHLFFSGLLSGFIGMAATLSSSAGVCRE